MVGSVSRRNTPGLDDELVAFDHGPIMASQATIASDNCRSGGGDQGATSTLGQSSGPG